MNTQRAQQNGGPLEGIVIADFSRVLAGPFCTMLLADLGARVIKVESPGGDDTRQWAPPIANDMSTYFMSANRNKESIALDLKDPADLETAHDIVARADVLIENFKPGGLQKFGLDPAQTTKRWPRLIHASINGFGSGKGAHLAGYDLLIQALSGLMHVTGEADGPAQKTGVAIVDVCTGLHCAVGILAALLERENSQAGQSLEVNLLSVALSSLANQSGGYAATGQEPQRMGNDHPSLYPYGPFQAQDQPLIIACGNDGQYRRLVEELGKPELADDERFATMQARNHNREILRAEIEEVLRNKPAHQWYEDFLAAGVMSAPINSVGQGIEFADSLGLDPVVAIHSAEGTAYRTVSNPVTYSRTPADYHSPPPQLGADGDAVRSWIARTKPRE